MTRRLWAVAIGCLLVAGCASQGQRTGEGAAVGSPPPVSLAPAMSPASSSPLSGLSSPAPVLSSPVDVGSETPPPLPTPVFGSEGTLPPMPPGGRTLDASDPDSVWAAQNVIDVFAEEVAAVAQDDPHYCNVAVDGFHDGMTVWWHGTPTASVSEVIVRARRAGIDVALLPTLLDRGPLDAAMATVSDRMQQVGLDEVSVSTDCSALDVGMVVLTPAVEAAVKALIGPGIPVKFEQTGPINPA